MTDDFDKRLNEALDENDLHVHDGQVEDKPARSGEYDNVGMAMGMRLTIEFLATIIAGALAGMWLDGKLDSSPWCVLVLVFLGFGVGLLNIYRMLNNIPDGIGLNRDALRERGLTKQPKSRTSDATKE